MKLREYLWQQDMLIRDFAKIIRYDPSYIGLVVKGKTKPGRKLCEEIEKATNGDVTSDDLLGVVCGRHRNEKDDEEQVS